MPKKAKKNRNGRCGIKKKAKLLFCAYGFVGDIGVVILDNLSLFDKVFVTKNLNDENEYSKRDGRARRDHDDVVKKRIENSCVRRKSRIGFYRQVIRQKRCRRRSESETHKMIYAVFARRRGCFEAR